MYIQQFLGRLDENNPGYYELVRYLEEDEDDFEVFVFAKNEGVQVVPLPNNRWAPVFDVNLKVCFLVPAGFHTVFIAALCGYHIKDCNCANTSSVAKFYANEYITLDYGWYITSITSARTGKYCAEMSPTYILDTFDKTYLKLLKDYHIRRGLR